MDRDGTIFAASFPKVLTTLKSFDDPQKVDAPSTIWRIKRKGKGEVTGPEDYEIEKVLEDKEAKVVGGATVARHDVKTGRIFIGGKYLPLRDLCCSMLIAIGAFAPYVTVCEPR